MIAVLFCIFLTIFPKTPFIKPELWSDPNSWANSTDSSIITRMGAVLSITNSQIANLRIAKSIGLIRESGHCGADLTINESIKTKLPQIFLISSLGFFLKLAVYKACMIFTRLICLGSDAVFIYFFPLY